jgi:hypothetical protein
VLLVGSEFFGRIGDGSVGESRKRGITAAYKYFNLFLAKKKASDDEATICNTSLFEEFASFLVSYANPASKDVLQVGTCVAYFGSVKETLRKKFPLNSIWKDHDTPKGGRNNDGGWFTRISAAIDKNAKLRNIERGMSIKDKATPLGRVGVQEIVKFLLRKNSKEGVLKAMYVLVTFLTVGRAGEAEWASWKQAEFNSVYSNLTIQWNEHKTHQQSFMDFFADRDNFKTDIYFLFALFWIAGSYLLMKTNFVFLKPFKTNFRFWS